MDALKELITVRKWDQAAHWDQVYEWEDIIKEKLGLTFSYDPAINKYAWRFPIPALTRLLHTSAPAFMFQFSADTKGWCNRENIIPCLIDFFLEEQMLPQFIKAHSRHPFLLISSKEAIAYLQEKGYHKPLYHLPLSISDKYAFSADCLKDKKYDLVVAGRTNSVLMGFLKRYAEEHPDFYYVHQKAADGNYHYFSSRGEDLGVLRGREAYLALLRQSRVGLYATPGMDDGASRTHGFNPVTPRFLELIASGCHVLARYPSTTETAFYQLSRFSPSIESYEQFEERMDHALSNDVDAACYADYLSGHYTSVRCELLKSIIQEYH